MIEVYCPGCRVQEFGDERCAPGGVFADGSVLADYQFTRTVSSITSLREFAFEDDHESNYYRYGVCAFTSGANAGLSREVEDRTRQDPEGVLILREPYPFAVEIGNEATLTAGWDRRFLLTCRNKFNNAKNYRDEPWLAGRDRMRRKGQRD